jgi:putative DNA primase/helicase
MDLFDYRNRSIKNQDAPDANGSAEAASANDQVHDLEPSGNGKMPINGQATDAHTEIHSGELGVSSNGKPSKEGQDSPLRDYIDRGVPPSLLKAVPTSKIAEQLRQFICPGQVTEARFLGVIDNPKYPSFTVSGFFDHAHLDEMARSVEQWSPKAEGCYFVFNPVDPEMLSVMNNRACRAKKDQASAEDKHVIQRRFIVVDFDPKRISATTGLTLPPKIPSSEGERTLAFERLKTVVTYLVEEVGWPPPILCDSGKGFHAIWEIDLPANDGGLVERTLKALDAMFSDDKVSIDTSLFNPSRIIKVYGSESCKGEDLPGRPHRYARVLWSSGKPFLSAEQLERVAAKAPQPNTPSDPPKDEANNQTSSTGRSNEWTPERRAIEYLKKCDPAISGQKGHDKTFGVACGVGPGFDLSQDDALRLITECYNPRCEPPWSEKELRHKVRDAYREETRRGWLRDEDRRNKTTKGDRELQAQRGFAGFAGPPRQVCVRMRPVPPLAPVMFPAPFRDWLEDIAERASCPLDLPAMAAVVALSAVVGRQVAIRPKRFDDWTVVPNLWGMGVLPPGWLKTHTLDEPRKPLARLEIDARERHRQALEEFAVSRAIAEAAAKSGKAALEAATKRGASPDVLRQLATQAITEHKQNEPTLRRYIVNDATVEKLGELLNENPNGLLVYRDELMGFLRSLEKQGHEGDRAFYLEAWNGTGSYTYDRIGRGSVFIASNTISILGGIQPSKLAAYIRGAASGENDDGLISRFQLAVYPDINQPYRHVDRWPNSEAKNRVYAVFQALDTLDPQVIGAATDSESIPYLRFSDDAQSFFDSWRTDLETRIRASQETASLTSHLSKYRSLMPSLALLFHLVDVAAGKASGAVSLTSARIAAAWCDYLEAHARRIYQFAFDGDPEPAQRLAERIKENLPNPFSVRDVVKKGWASLTTTEAVERAIAILEEHDWVRQVEVPPGPEGGRPKTEIHINPLAQGNKE